MIFGHCTAPSAEKVDKEKERKKVWNKEIQAGQSAALERSWTLAPKCFVTKEHHLQPTSCQNTQ